MRSTLWFLAFAYATANVRSMLVTEFEWKYFDYVWGSAARKHWYTRNGVYIPQRMTPIDVDRSHQDKRVFVTMLKTRGVPASLNTVSSSYSKSGPLLRPYPNWSWYEKKHHCSGIVNVIGIRIDQCNRLWALDSGFVENRHLCPAKLLVFDLDTDELIFKEVIDDRFAQNKEKKGLLVTPVIETYNCNSLNATVYMADTQGHGLVIWSSRNTVRLEANVFKPEKRHTSISVADERFDLADGILGMALSPPLCPTRRKSPKEHCSVQEDRFLYFRPLASRSLYGADTRVLKHSFHLESDVSYFGAVNVLPSQTTVQAFSSEGTLFYGLTGINAIGCWNLGWPMVPKYFRTILTDNNRLQFTSGMKVVKNSFLQRNKEYLLLMTSRFQKSYPSRINLREINFRILTAPIRSLIEGTLCDKHF